MVSPRFLYPFYILLSKSYEVTDRALFPLDPPSQDVWVASMAICSLCLSNENKYAYLSLVLLLSGVVYVLMLLWNAMPV